MTNEATKIDPHPQSLTPGQQAIIDAIPMINPRGRIGGSDIIADTRLNYATAAPPDQPKMCSMGGLQYPMPESVAPEIGTSVYIANLGSGYAFAWTNHETQIHWIKENLLHLNNQACEQHVAAMRAANMQAVENAK